MFEKIQLVCPHCTAVNRLPGNKLSSQPSCGKCKTELLVNNPLEIDSETLDKHIHRSSFPVLVDFWAPWCGPCQSFAPTFSSYARDVKTRLRCLKLNTETNQASGVKYGIRSIPTLAIFNNGKEINRISGALSQSQLQQWVEQQLH